METVCKECKAPIDRNCVCPPTESCKGLTHIYCHVCRWMYGVIYRSEYLTAAHRADEATAKSRRDRMGL